MSKKPPPAPRKNKNKRKRKRKRNTRDEGLSVAASALIAASGLPMEAQYPVSRPLRLQYEFDGPVVIPQRSNSARTASSSLSELAAIQRDQYPEYLDSKKDPKGYVTQVDPHTLLFGGRKTRRKNRRRKTKKKRKTKRKKRRRKRKTKKRRK